MAENNEKQLKKRKDFLLYDIPDELWDNIIKEKNKTKRSINKTFQFILEQFFENEKTKKNEIK